MRNLESRRQNWLLLKFLGCERPGCSQDKVVCITLRYMPGKEISVSSSIK